MTEPRPPTPPKQGGPDIGALPQGVHPPNRVERLAAEYIERKLSGEEASLEEYVLQLQDDAERTQLQDLVESVQHVEGLLPRQVREGTVLSGRYRIERQLGAGGMGKVFAARDLTLERRVAVKILAGLDTSELDFGALFERESRLLAQMQHPNIVSIREAASDGDVRYIVMDLVEGKSLGDVLEGAGDSPTRGDSLKSALDLPAPAGGQSLIEVDSWVKTSARIVAEVARTLEAAHAHGVIHRDIKPGNIMLRGDASPVILDFGLAGNMQSETGQLTRGLFGSAAYVAPEQAESGHVGNDPRTDVYQIGLVLYEMLTLSRAFPAGDLSTVLKDIVAGRTTKPRDLNRDIPFELEAIVLKAMHLRPSGRYATARALREDLERYLAGTQAPLAARGGHLAAFFRDARAFTKRNRTQCLVAAALAIGVMIGVWLFGASDDFQVRATRGRAATGVVDVVADHEVVQADDFLGVLIDSDDAVFVYAFSIVGTADDPSRFISPVKPARRDRLVEDLRRHGFGLPLAAGDHDLLCSQVEPRGDPGSSWTEGLLVLSPSEQQAGLELWMADLARARNPEEPGVPYQLAMKMLDPTTTPRGSWNGGRRGPPRGRSLKTLDEGERIQLQTLMSAVRVTDRANLGPFADMRPFRVYFRAWH